MTTRDLDSASVSTDPASENDVTAAVPSQEPRLLANDPVSDVLDTIRLQGAVFFLWEPSWPFGIGVAHGRQLSRHVLTRSECIVSYHIVNEGPCWAAVNGEEPLQLKTGDTLVLPRGDAYKIASTPQYPTREDESTSIEFFRSMASDEAPTMITEGGNGPERSRLICGFLGCNLGPFNPLLSSLPRMMCIPAPPEGDDPLSALIGFALSESQERRGGERSLLMRLSEVMFVEILRRHLRSSGQIETGWLAALGDPLVGRALACMHGEPGRSWTLQVLAEATGASRSVLAARFSQTVGLPAMQYLTRWRMQLAAHRLLETSAKVFVIAAEAGYDSEEAFSRAFKRIVGVSPSAWRRDRQSTHSHGVNSQRRK